MGVSKNYTSGPIGSVIIRTALSMLPGTLAISGYNIVDTYFVAQLGVIPLAAMGYTFPVVMLIGCLYRGLDNGMLTPAAQALGGNKLNRARSLISSGIILLTCVSLIVGVVGMFTIEPVFKLLKANHEVMGDIRNYMAIWYLGSVTGALSMASNSLLVTAGVPRLAGLMMLGGLVLNAVLDPLFIFGWGWFPAMGVAGAALATIIAQSVGMCVSLAILHCKLHLIGSFLMPLKIIAGYWKTIFRYGIPAACAMLLVPIGSMVVTYGVTAVGGNDAVAAVAAAGRVEMVAFVFPMSLGMTLLPMIGQNYGAKQWDRINSIRRFAMRFAEIMLILMAVIYFVFARQIAAFFTDDAEVAAIMIEYLRLVPWGFAGIEVHRFGGFFLTACARPFGAAVLNGGRVAFLLIPLTLIAVFFESLTGIFIARLATDIIAGVAGLICARWITRGHLTGGK